MAKKRRKKQPEGNDDEFTLLSGDFTKLAEAIEHYTTLKEKEFKEWVGISAEVDQIVAMIRDQYTHEEMKKLIEQEQDVAKKLLMIVGITVVSSYNTDDPS